MYEYLSFRLPDDFVDQYADRKPNWGFDIGADNSLAELTFITKYSRKLPDGTKERWHDTVRRCIEGMYSLLKDHCKENRTPWNETKAQRSAQDAFERMYTFKWLPPGRGMWMMGTAFVHEEKNSAPLQNCAFVSTEKISSRSVYEATLPFVRLMEMSMHGIGVGFDSKGSGKLTIHEPTDETFLYVVEDSREGWVESVAVLLESYFFENRPTVIFDYTKVRPAGAPLVRFGGVAAGPDPLIDLHEAIRAMFDGRVGEKITKLDIGDIMNLEGKCVVAGSNRRSAEIWLDEPNDKEFINAKNYLANPERMGVVLSQDGHTIMTDEKGSWIRTETGGWGQLSNNSVFARVGGNYDNLVENIMVNGEPGLFYLDLARSHGRLADPPNNRDYRVVGVNPCAEQSLEHLELCTLVETFPHHHEDYEDFRQTLKSAYLYAKAVTLLPTQWAESNEVMQRNRRIGCSVSGLAQFVESRGINMLREWLDQGYEFICHRDTVYSEWLGVRESLKKTSVKPSGTVSLVAGATPGAHWPTGPALVDGSENDYLRRQRFSVSDPMVPYFIEAGYHVEPDVSDPKFTVVVTFPTRGPLVRTETQVSVWEKAMLAAMLQRYWADNQVSCTLTFKESERHEVGPIIKNFDGQLKSISFLPIFESTGAYAQMPYEGLQPGERDKLIKTVKPINWDAIYDGDALDATGERFCSNDVCELP